MRIVTNIPNSAERKKASKTIMKISRFTSEKLQADQFTFSLCIRSSRGENEEVIDVPPTILTYLEFILTNMSQGKGLEMTPLEESLSTQQAADLLSVSRPFLIKLLEEGKIPFQKVGTHRRVKLNDVRVYEQQQQAIRDQQLDFLARQAQDLNMGYE